MNKILKTILTSIICICISITLAGCSTSVYDDYSKAGASLDKDNVFEKISTDDLVNKINEKNGIFYVYYASSEDATSRSEITIYNEQANQYQIEVIYYLNAADYTTVALRKELKEKISINDASKVPSMLVYVDGNLKFDSSRESVRSNYDTAQKVSGHIFRDMIIPAEVN